MKKDLIKGILKEYDHKCALYEEFADKVKKLIDEILIANNIRIHSITFRMKKKDSLKLKLARSDPGFKKLSDVTDISGIRIITYFADEVDSIASLIQKEFAIDPVHSIDKRALLDPDRFGYLSIHYVAKLTPSRLKLTEYNRFSNCKVEIQIRSILQHTWAEIEHDLGYKSKVATPKYLQRRFYQLAGLLELADDEFTRLRNQLSIYENSVPSMIVESPFSVTIDKASLSAFIQSNELVKKLDHEIETLTNCKVIRISGFIIGAYDITRLYNAGFNTIADIENHLEIFKEKIPKFALKIMGSAGGETDEGISVFYLCYVKVASSNSLDVIRNFIDNALSEDSASSRATFSRQILSFYKEISQ